jgi:hypothetical protein
MGNGLRLLRLFFKLPLKGNLRGAETWTIDLGSRWIPGTLQIDSQMFSPMFHPYLRIHEGVLNLTTNERRRLRVLARDISHTLEVEHSGNHDGNVTYMVATPTSEEKKYVRSQLKALLER